MLRSFTGFIAGAFLGSALLAGVATAQQAARPKPEPQAFTFTTLEILDGDGELQRLLKQRYNAAGEDLEARLALYSGGRVDLVDVAASIERFTKAGLELAKTPVERVNELQRALAAAQNVEAIVSTKYEQEVEPVQAYKHARYVRLDLEIQLLRAREAAKLGAAPAPAANFATARQ